MTAFVVNHAQQDVVVAVVPHVQVVVVEVVLEIAVENAMEHAVALVD